MMQRLLLDCNRPGYPSEYLVSRIHGRIRKGTLSAEIPPGETNIFIANDEMIWGEASRERRWIYVQMNNSLRKIFSPLFFYYELNTLITSLRSLETGLSQSMSAILEQSLLSENLRKVIQEIATPEEMVARLEKLFTGSPLEMSGMVLAYREGGVQRCEELIRRKFLEQVTIICENPEIITFFRMIIDFKNTMAMAKNVHWKMKKAPIFIGGGLHRLLKTEKALLQQYLGTRARRFTGGREITDAELHPVKLEQLLHDSLSRKMKRLMLSFCPVLCCIGYLWHCFSSAKKRSGEYHTARFADNFPVLRE